MQCAGCYGSLCYENQKEMPEYFTRLFIYFFMHTKVCTVMDLPRSVQLVCRGGAVFAKHRGWRSARKRCRILYILGFALYCAVKVR